MWANNYSNNSIAHSFSKLVVTISPIYYALLVLANTYNPWLYEEKEGHGDKLWTEQYDHDPDIDIVNDSIVD